MIRPVTSPERIPGGRFAGYRTYADYLLSDTWISRRNAFINTFPKRCFVCETTSSCQLHHLTYARLGAELDSDMIWLCNAHHREIHRSSIATLPDSNAHLRMRSVWVVQNARRLDAGPRRRPKKAKRKGKKSRYASDPLKILIGQQRADMARSGLIPHRGRRP